MHNAPDPRPNRLRSILSDPRIGISGNAAKRVVLMFALATGLGLGTVTAQAQDFGDAPDSYMTLLASGGPSHAAVPGPILGVLVDAEPDALYLLDGTGDDTTGIPDDEDGIAFLTSIIVSASSANTASVTVTNGSPFPGLLDAWMDFNGNGSFEPGEFIAGGMGPPTLVPPGTLTLSFTVPSGATPGPTFTRFRISTPGGLAPGGPAIDGEVEDYMVMLVDGSTPAPVSVAIPVGATQPLTIASVGGTGVSISDAVQTFLSIPVTAASTLAVDGTAGDDVFTIDFSAGDPIPSGGLMVDGKTDAGSGDSMVLTGGGAFSSVAYTSTNANDGVVVVGSYGTINYEDLEPIVDGLTAATKSFTFTGAVDAVTLDTGYGGTWTNFIDAPTVESVEFKSPTSSIAIDGGGGDDTFSIEAATYTISVDGGSETASDTFDLSIGGLSSTTITLVETSETAGTYSFDTGEGDVTYTDMEIVGMRYSDPAQFSASTYKGDYMYPLHKESGISIEPYFNWDVANWPAVSVISTLTLDIADNSSMTSPFFSKAVTGSEYYITDEDDAGDTGIVLGNDTDYWWSLTADMASSNSFFEIRRFTTLDELMPSLTYPEDGLTIHSNEFDFSWNVGAPAADDVYWRLDIDEAEKTSFAGASPSESGGDAENDDDTAGADGYSSETNYGTTSLSSDLTAGETYTWRAATMWPIPPTGWVPQEIFDLDEADRMVSISALSEFDISGQAASAPTPSWPTGGATVYTNEPTLNWYTGGSFDDLTFTVKIKPAGGAVFYTKTGITGLSFDVPSGTLTAGVDYEWNVTSTDGASISPVSIDAAFTTNGPGTPVKPTPSYPVDNLEIYTTAPTLHWFTETDNSGQSFIAYHLERSGPAPATCEFDLSVAGGVVTSGPVTVTQVDITGLEPGETYDWCVKATGSGGSEFSDVVSFAVAGGPTDGLPIASWPIGNPTVYALSQQLNWYVEGSALAILSYSVETCDNSAYTVGCTTVASITVQYYDLTGLSYGDVVYWRVKAHYSGGGESVWTDTDSQGSFTVIGALSSLTAELTYPIDDLVVYTPDVTFSWFVNGSTQASSKFMIEYSYVETFPSIGSITKSATTTDSEYSVTDLIPGHTYWWRVKISNDGGSTYGSWSTVKSFSVAPGAAPVMPRVGSPANNVFVATMSPTLSWSIPAQSQSTLTYELALGQVEDLSDATTITGIDATHYRVTDLADGTYYWQVRSRTTDGTPSALSSVGIFVTIALSVDVEDEVVSIPDEYRLEQNYPNPFNPATTIEYNVPLATDVSIRVYNMLGQLVKTLVSGQVQAGVHRVVWDARDASGNPVTSGLYIYRIRTAEYSQARTLVLLK